MICICCGSQQALKLQAKEGTEKIHIYTHTLTLTQKRTNSDITMQRNKTYIYTCLLSTINPSDPSSATLPKTRQGFLEDEDEEEDDEDEEEEGLLRDTVPNVGITRGNRPSIQQE